jgi:VanZ family protein
LFNFLERNKIYLVYIPLVVYWIFLLLATSLPTTSLPSVAVGDKIKHFLAFFGLSVLLSLTFMYQNKNQVIKKYFLVAALITTSFYGLIDEIHQSFIPGRYCVFFDWTADSLGGIAGVLLVYYFIKKFNYVPSTT